MIRVEAVRVEAILEVVVVKDTVTIELSEFLSKHASP